MIYKAAPKRILYLIDTLTTGGAQTALFNIVTNLDRTQYDPFVISLFKDGRVGEALRQRGIYTQCLDITAPFNIVNIVKYHRILSRFAHCNQIDLVHASLSASGIYGGILAKRVNAPSVLNVHGLLSKPSVCGWKARYIELLARALNNMLIAGNRLTERELHRYRLWRDGERITQIYNGIVSEDGAMAELFTEDAIKITMVANFFPEKDYMTLIKAYERIKSEYPVHLQIIAEGNNKYSARVKAFIAEKGLDVTINPNREEDTYTRKTNILVLTSHTEGDPLVLKEAMAVGLPVVASDVGAVNEVVDDGINGLLVPEGSVEGVVLALKRLIEDECFRSEIARNAVLKYQSKFTIDVMRESYNYLYGRIFN
jgi:glycosyltransferase involved in cell wall biosynthesis